MTAHTPGPWRWQDCYLEGDGKVILSIGEHYPPEDANARLIAAAPDLLSAVKDFVNAFGAGKLYPSGCTSGAVGTWTFQRRRDGGAVRGSDRL